MELKKFCSGLLMLFLMAKVYADDVTASVTPSGFGMENGAVTLTISGGYAPYVFSWTGPDGFVSMDQNITGLAPGDYCVTVTDAYCGTAIVCVTVDESAQNEIATPVLADLQMYPVPADNSLHIACRAELPGSYTCYVYTLDGGSLFQIRIEAQNGMLSANIPTAALPAGMYTLVLQHGEGDQIILPFPVNH